jgi:low affinity Fe/Cu permease
VGRLPAVFVVIKRMKSFSSNLTIVLALALILVATSVFAQQRAEPLTNAAVIKLVRAGFKEKTVIAIIHSRANTFDLNADRLIELKHNGVTENVILAMLSQGGADFSSSDDLSDDAFFRNGPGTVRDDNNDREKDQSTSIFGSGGSSKSQSRGRGMSGSSEGDTQTTGSATVRILRPPVEAGGATVKLEKTSTLNNDSVIQLVEAGFSEGTIVKRIEKSPVEFDLSPAKLNELRKHRVTEPIIAAMSAAMGETPTPKNAAPETSREN